MTARSSSLTAARAIATTAPIRHGQRTAPTTWPPPTKASPCGSPRTTSSRPTRPSRRRSPSTARARLPRQPDRRSHRWREGNDQFGLHDMHLHYSVNGGPDRDVSLLKRRGAKNADGTYTLRSGRLQARAGRPGEPLCHCAKDGHAEARTDIIFIQADPFEREFSQSQQAAAEAVAAEGPVRTIRPRSPSAKRS